VGIFGPIVLPAADFPAFEVADLPHRRAIGAQAVGDDDLGTAIALHSFLEEFQGAGLVPRLADEELQHLALVIDAPPKIVELTVDLYENLVGAPRPAAKVSGPHQLSRCHFLWQEAKPWEAVASRASKVPLHIQRAARGERRSAY
jgi:hypothetical protein